MSREKVRLGIVVSEFHWDITYLMLERALDHARFLQADVAYVYKVPGSFDIPGAAKSLLEKADVDAVVALGAIIEGETKHDELIGHQVARKLVDLSVEYGKPVTFGVIGHGATRVQAQERIDEYSKRAVEAAVKLVKRFQKAREATFQGKTVTIE